MPKLYYLFLGISLLFFTACEEKKTDQVSIPVENTTEIFTPKDKKIQGTKHQKETRKTVLDPLKTAIDTQSIEKQNDKTQLLSGTLTIRDIDGNSYTLERGSRYLRIREEPNKIVLINLFASWCPPCKGQLPYLGDIKNKFQKELFVLGIDVNDDIGKESLKSLLSDYQVSFPVTQDNTAAEKIVSDIQLPRNYPLPLTILYKDGKYIMHYEGASPIEMISHDIKRLKDL